MIDPVEMDVWNTEVLPLGRASENHPGLFINELFALLLVKHLLGIGEEIG